MTPHDLFEVLEKATTHATSMAESGPLTERSPAPVVKERSPRVRSSGTYRIGQAEGGEVLRSYLLQESRQKEAAAESIQWLAESLRELRGPAEFIRKAEQAAHETLRQARSLAEAARVDSVEPPSQHPEGPPADLWALSLSLSTERCVVDTYAAARFAFQSRIATSLELRSVFHDIARQDAVHATLFWEILAWALSHISPARARQIAEEQRTVREALRLAIEAPLPVELHELAGVPDADAGHALLDALEFQLWDEVAA